MVPTAIGVCLIDRGSDYRSLRRCSRNGYKWICGVVGTRRGGRRVRWRSTSHAYTGGLRQSN